MSRAPTLHPFAEMTPFSERAFKEMGFRFTDITLSRSPEGWLLLQVDWDAKVDRFKVKYPRLDSSGYSRGGGVETDYIELEFPQVVAPYWSSLYGGSPFENSRYAERHKASIEVGIGIRTGRQLNPPRLSHRYSHHSNTKYGVCVYYEPRDWGRGDYKVLSSWRARRRKDGTLV